jgi:PAS domain S-box-containing protein
MDASPLQCLTESLKYEAVFQGAPLGIYTINKEGIIDSFNPEMVKLSGATRAEDVVGLNALTLPTYQEAGLTEHFRKGLAGEGFFVPTVKYTSYTSNKVSFRSYRGIPIYDAGGSVEHLLCLVLDVTEKFEIEEERRRADKLATIIKQSPDAIIVVGSSEARIIEYWNPSAEKLFGWTPTEAVGKSLRDFIVPLDKRTEMVSYLDRLKSESIVHVEVPRVHKDGHVILVELYIFPIKDETGAIVQLAAILRDITARKQSEERMMQQDDELKKINNFMVGRELRMAALKEEIRQLKEKLERA